MEFGKNISAFSIVDPTSLRFWTVPLNDPLSTSLLIHAYRLSSFYSHLALLASNFFQSSYSLNNLSYSISTIFLFQVVGFYLASCLLFLVSLVSIIFVDMFIMYSSHLIIPPSSSRLAFDFDTPSTRSSSSHLQLSSTPTSYSLLSCIHIHSGGGIFSQNERFRPDIHFSFSSGRLLVLLS